MPRDFAQLQKQIEDALGKLKATTAPSVRLDALKEMRDLLREADRLLHPDKDPNNEA